MNIGQLHSIYFIGVGGIGMSALARYFKHLGMEVAGYDKTSTSLTKQLESEGIDIHYTVNVDAVPKSIDLVVYTPAVPEEMGELVHLRAMNRPVHKRSEVLGWISKSRRTIAIAGTHGKTTTSTLLAHLLRAGGVSCTAFLGGISLNLKSNFVAGSSDWVVVEADEYDKSFLQLEPEISAILSIDADHLDIYGDGDHLVQTYRAFAEKTKSNGSLFVHADIKLDALNYSGQLFSFGISQGSYSAANVAVVDGTFEFELFNNGENLGKYQSVLPGRHNIQNAVVALAIAHRVGVEVELLQKGMESFMGIARRFQFRLRNDYIVLIDDYAHHPAELTAAISAAKELYPNQKITGVFQPHLYSRTRDFAAEFGASLDLLDEVFLLPIYPAREIPIEGVTSKSIGDHVVETSLEYVEKSELTEALVQTKPEVVMMLGAGDIDACVPEVEQALQKLIRA